MNREDSRCCASVCVWRGSGGGSVFQSKLIQKVSFLPSHPAVNGVPGPGIRSELQQVLRRQSFHPLCRQGIDPVSWCSRDTAHPVVLQQKLQKVPF